MKSTVVDESLSTTTTIVLFQRETTYVLQEPTELEIYIKAYITAWKMKGGISVK